MSQHLKTGILGEQLAQQFLKDQGMTILECNWRFSKAEIDIIAKEDEVLIFVEVKTRTSDFFGKPEEFVSDKKQRLMIDAAFQYMEAVGHDWEVRFDIISVLIGKSPNNPKIEHFKDAFF